LFRETLSSKPSSSVIIVIVVVIINMIIIVTMSLTNVQPSAVLYQFKVSSPL
jgi:hypothetical protein